MEGLAAAVDKIPHPFSGLVTHIVHDNAAFGTGRTARLKEVRLEHDALTGKPVIVRRLITLPPSRSATS